VTESLFKAVTPDGRVAIEVTVPTEAEGAEAILFQCSVILDGKTVLEELKTVDQNKMMHWMHRQMIEAMRRTT